MTTDQRGNTTPADGPCRPSSIVLDSAHVGDIRSAFGTLSNTRKPIVKHWSRGWRSTAILGPGIIVMVGDNDAGGVSTYAQAGQNYGYSLLWSLVLLIPVLIVNQEMVVRLGAVTGVGHARLIKERFGKFWGWFSVGDLFLLNFLTISTEFIGVSLPWSLRCSKYSRRSARRRRADRDHRQRQLPPLGAGDVRLRVRQPARDPAFLAPPQLGERGHAPRHP